MENFKIKIIDIEICPDIVRQSNLGSDCHKYKLRREDGKAFIIIIDIYYRDLDARLKNVDEELEDLCNYLNANYAEISNLEEIREKLKEIETKRWNENS